MTTVRKITPLVLILLLSADIAFVVLHLLHAYTPYAASDLFDVGKDRGFAEIYQYVKWYWITILMLGLAIHTRSIAYCFWALIFGFLLIDDACQVHERMGDIIATRFGYGTWLLLKPDDWGELTMGLLAGIVILLLIGCAFRLGNAENRKVSKKLCWLLGTIILFGVVIDMVHVILKFLPIGPVLAAIEDGGEMIVASMACWYAYAVLEGGGREPLSQVAAPVEADCEPLP